MGDLVIKGPNGEERRFTHEDFEQCGEKDLFGLKIAFSPRWETMTGGYQIAFYHTSLTDTEKQEKQLGGHNASYGDVFGVMGMFTSTREQRNAVHEMTLPDGKSVYVTHEWGEHGTVEGQTIILPEQLTSSVVNEQPQRGFFVNLLGRRK